MFSWCCCRENTSSATEDRIRDVNKMTIGLTSTDLPVDDIEGTSELQTPRETVAQRMSIEEKRLLEKKRENNVTTASADTTHEQKLPDDYNKNVSSAEAPSKDVINKDKLREIEREKLKRLVYEFAKATATNGLSISIYNPLTESIEPRRFQMDSYFMWFVLSSVKEAEISQKVQYMMTNVTAVVKGKEIGVRAPNFPSHLIEDSVLLDSVKPEDKILFVFSNAREKREFYTCIKIIRSSVDISRGTRQGNHDN